MDKTTARRIYDSLIYLISCALAGEKPQPDLELGDINQLLHFARHHSLNALAISALSSAGLAPESAIIERNMAIRKIMLLDAERENLLLKMREHGIKYMVLKGVIIKELYPSIGDRQMSDNDILFDPKERKSVRDVMLSLGYEIESYGQGNHDVYIKKPVYNFEMHTSLFDSYSNPKMHSYFLDALDKAGRGDNELARVMTDEDYYIYIKAHEYKHYSAGGTGIRSLADTFVYLKAKESKLNRTYIEAELQKLGILDYERSTASLAFKIFDHDFSLENMRAHQADSYIDPLSESERQMLDVFFLSGSYGNTKQMVENEIKQKNKDGKGGKISYVLSHAFPPMEFYKSQFPFFYKHKILIPFLVIARIFGMLFLRPRATFTKLKTAMKYNKKG